MSTQSKVLSFKGQKIFVGLDVHLRSWSVTVLSEQSVLKKYTQDPSPAVLHKFLTNTYPDAEYHSITKDKAVIVLLNSQNAPGKENVGMYDRIRKRLPYSLVLRRVILTLYALQFEWTR